MSHSVGAVTILGTCYSCCYEKCPSQDGAGDGGGTEGDDSDDRMETVLLVELQMAPRV